MLFQAARRVEDDIVGIAKSVAENYEDEELRSTFINVSLDLCVWISMLSSPRRRLTIDANAVFLNSR